MAYPKRVYTDGVEEVSYVDMNRIETGIETNDLAIAKINADNIARDKEISTKETITGAQEKANVTLKSAKEYADGKVKLNGSTTNVNFKKNEIVQDGLIKSFNERISSAKKVDGILTTGSNNISLLFANLFSSVPSTGEANIFSTLNGAIKLVVQASGILYLVYYVDSKFTYLSTGLNLKTTNTCNLYVNLNGSKATIVVDGKQLNYDLIAQTNLFTTNANCYLLGAWDGSQTVYSTLNGFCTYSMELTTQEIKHIFSVLNNTSSISSIETTDSSLVKTSFLLSSDTDHVMTRTGHTEEERYIELLKTMGKEFTSTGADITVNNAIEKQRVLSGKISGQTVKNYSKSDEKTITGDGATYRTTSTTLEAHLESNTDYYLHVFVTENTLVGSNFVASHATSGAFTTGANINAGQVGYFKFALKTKTVDDASTLNYILSQVNNTGTGTVKYRIIVTKENVNLNSPIPFGLNSTQAILTNNGVKYPFYASAEDKAIGTVITLGGFDIIRDTLEQLEDGSGIYTKNTEKYTFTGDEFVTLLSGFPPTDTNFARFTINIPHRIATRSAGMCDKADWVNLISTTTNKFAFGGSDAASGATVVHCIIEKANLSTVDAEGLKAYLKANPVTVYYQLYIPVITFIDKGLMPVITTEETNTFSMDSAVKPSAIEVTVAVDKVSNLETRLAQVEKVMTSTSNLSLLGNYAEDEYNNLINQL